jgi:hypothetical protein
MVVELATSPRPESLQAALAAELGDPGLRIFYPDPVDRWIDAAGGRAAPPEAATPVVDDGGVLALVAHAPGLLDSPGAVEAVATTARLALDHERLRATTLARAGRLRASRARIVAVGDAERRRIERDLHDGAQQRLVTLALRLRLERAGADPDDRDRLARAERDVRTALAELRDIAHGIYPVALAEEGLAAAIDALAENAERPFRITALPSAPVPADVASAAYFVVSEVVGRVPGPVVVDARLEDGDLRLVIDGVSIEEVDLVELTDRVGALDGALTVVDARIEAVLPCG